MTRPASHGPVIAFVLCAVLLAWALHAAVTVGGRRAVRTTAPAPGPAYAARGLVPVRAAMHLHTEASWDGTGSLDALLHAARDAEIDVLFLSEHNNTHAWEEAGWHDGVLVIPGEEVSLREGHELVWGVSRAGLDVVNALSDSVRSAALDSLVRAEGGFAATAHPRGGRKPWKGSLPASATAIEIVNGDVAWRDDGAEELIRALFFYPLDGRAALASLVDTPRPALAWWDSLLATRLVFGLAGLDAHGGVRSGRWTLPFPPYGAVMGLAHQCLWIRDSLPTDAALAASEILDALRAGHHFAALEGFGSAMGFASWAESAGRTAIAGDSIALAPGTLIHARVPRDPRIIVRLLCGGRLIDESRTWEAEFPVVEPGIYRLEVYQRRNDPFGHSLEIPWIYSNPIVITID